MAAADDINAVAEGVWLWHSYDRDTKTELFSSAFRVGSDLFIVDPIRLVRSALADLSRGGNIAAILVTNANHERAAAEFAVRFQCPVFARAPAGASSRHEDISQLSDIQVIPIDGGAPDEVALCSNGTLIVGDALIHFQPYGFTLLPPKYCSDPKVLRESLRQLARLEPRRILFAHGDPIVQDASARLTALIEKNA